MDGYDYRTGIYNKEPSTDKFSLPALKIEYDLGGIDLISNTSYFHRERAQVLDYTTFLSTLRGGGPFATYGNKDPSNAFAAQTLEQKNSRSGSAPAVGQRGSARRLECWRVLLRYETGVGEPLGLRSHSRRHLERLPAVPRSVQPVRRHRCDGQAVCGVRLPRFPGELAAHG